MSLHTETGGDGTRPDRADGRLPRDGQQRKHTGCKRGPAGQCIFKTFEIYDSRLDSNLKSQLLETQLGPGRSMTQCQNLDFECQRLLDLNLQYQ